MTKEVSESPQSVDESGHSVVDRNGDLVVGDRLWTVFCKEVCSNSSPFCCASPTEVELGICNWCCNADSSLCCIPGGADSPSSSWSTSPHAARDRNSSTMSTSGDRRHIGFYKFLVNNTSAAHDQEDLHPLPSQMLFLWQIYMDNVVPFMKFLHVPTMTKFFSEVRGSYHTLGPSMHAIILVISLAAVVSLEDEEVSPSVVNGHLADKFGLSSWRTSTPIKSKSLFAINVAPN